LKVSYCSNAVPFVLNSGTATVVWLWEEHAKICRSVPAVQPLNVQTVIVVIVVIVLLEFQNALKSLVSVLSVADLYEVLFILIFFKDKNIRKNLRQPPPEGTRLPPDFGKILKLFWAMPVNSVCPQSPLVLGQTREFAPFVYAYKR